MELVAGNENREIVRNFYQTFLDRPPEPAGALHYEGLINRLGLAKALPEMLTSFLNSEEFERIQASRARQVAYTFATYGDLLIEGMPVSHVASLGTHCLGSTILKNAGLKKYSLPFDWLFATPQMVLDCLTDDFTTFLDRRDYQSTTESRCTPSADHEHYRDRYGEWVFAHRDPTQDDDYRYLVRSVERFRHLLASTDAKLFVMVSRAKYDLPAAFPYLIEALERRTVKFSLLGIHLADHTGQPGISAVEPIAQQGEHSLYRFTPSSNEHGIGYFPDRLDEWTILRLICRYRFSLKDSP
jgi:hypothetical protein